MSDTFALDAEKRVITGKKVRSIREDGYIPAVISEKNKESINVRVPYVPLQKAYNAVGMGQPIALSVEKKKYLVMIKDVHVDPAKNTIMHVAFHAVNAKDPVESEVRVHIEGDVPAERDGNFLVRQNDVVTVKGLPADLPDMVVVMADSLINPGDSITVADIVPIKDIEIITEPEAQLAVVTEPTAQEEEPEETEDVDASDVPAANGGEESESEEKSE